MDHYFCRSCLSKWKRDETMATCPGCQGHVEYGWTPTDLIRVYGPVLNTYEKVFFPNLKRLCPPPVAYPNVDVYPHVDVHVATDWLRSANVLPGFKTQQRKFIHTFKKQPTKEHWDLMDPEIQIRIRTTLNLRYT